MAITARKTCESKGARDSARAAAPAAPVPLPSGTPDAVKGALGLVFIDLGTILIPIHMISVYILL